MSDPKRIDTVVDDLRQLIVKHVSANPNWYGSLTMRVTARNGVLVDGEIDVHIVDTCKNQRDNRHL